MQFFLTDDFYGVMLKKLTQIHCGKFIWSVTETHSTPSLPRQEAMRLVLFGTWLHCLMVVTCSFQWQTGWVPVKSNRESLHWQKNCLLLQPKKAGAKVVWFHPPHPSPFLESEDDQRNMELKGAYFHPTETFTGGRISHFVCLTCFPDVPFMIACYGVRTDLAVQRCWSLQKVQMLNTADHPPAPGIVKFWNWSSVQQEESVPP